MVSLRKIKNYIIFVIFGCVEKDKYSLLQYESAKYLSITLIKIKIILIKIL